MATAPPPDPTDTAPTEAVPNAPPPLQDAPGSVSEPKTPKGSGKPPLGSQGEAGSVRGKGRAKATGKGHPKGTRLPVSGSEWEASGSRAREQKLLDVGAEVSGAAGPPPVPPVPLAIACAMHGVPLSVVERGLAAGAFPALERARAHGRALAARLACGTGPDARQWAWLAERLAPKELHLPTKVHTGQDPDAAPQETRVTVELGQARELARGVVQVLPAGARGTLPPGRS
jgi:hypothetical protein